MKTIEEKNKVTTQPTVQAKKDAFFGKKGEDSFFSGSADKNPSFFTQSTVQARVAAEIPDIQKKEITTIQRESLATPLEDEKLGTAEQRIEEDKLVQEKPMVQKKCAACREKEKMQAKLEIGGQNDPYEKEADDIGEQVSKNFDNKNQMQEKLTAMGVDEELLGSMALGDIETSKRLKTIQPSLQTKCAECEKDQVQKMPEKIQRSSVKTTLDPDDVESNLRNSRGMGESMDTKTQNLMESSMNADFSDVKIHRSAKANNMAEALNAHAFTYGNDIFFNTDRYQPNTSLGVGLLAHELAHTIQQGASKQREEHKNQNTDHTLYGLKNGISFNTLGQVNETRSKKTKNTKNRLSIQRCPQGEKKRVTIRYRKYGSTAFDVRSGGGSCPAYCACRNDAQGNPVSGGPNRISPAPVNGNCPPGFQITWEGSGFTWTEISRVPLESEPCGFSESRSCR